jgi:hypothetical protein
MRCYDNARAPELRGAVHARTGAAARLRLARCSSLKPGSSPASSGATVHDGMTAKEQLRERIETLTEREAERTLRLLDDLRDPLTKVLDDAPLDDEPTTPEEEALVQEARDEIACGELISADEIRREFG